MLTFEIAILFDMIEFRSFDRDDVAQFMYIACFWPSQPGPSDSKKKANTPTGVQKSSALHVAWSGGDWLNHLGGGLGRHACYGPGKIHLKIHIAQNFDTDQARYVLKVRLV